jgi:hypothetical protein
MIMVSSEGARALAKARHEHKTARETHRRAGDQYSKGLSMAAWSDFLDAAEALADEIIAEGHHLAEGD